MLDRLAFGAGEVGSLRKDALAGDNVEGLAVLSTCNRLELIADVSAFHGGLADLGNALVSSIDKEWSDIAAHFYAHYDTQAMEHLLKVARSEEHTSELQSRGHLVCRLLLEKTKNI